MSLVLGAEDDSFADPFAISLPSTRSLWEARDCRTWEMEYDSTWHAINTAAAEGPGSRRRLLTIGDLARAQNRGAVDDDIVDGWRGDMDSLGMLVSAVVAGA